MPDIAHQLAVAGVVLFLLGLLNGFFIPVGRSPRLALSAHLTAVQSGTFLVAMSLLWPHIGFPVGADDLIGSALWVSLYLLWLALCLAGSLGAGRGLPIAGGGIKAKPSYQIIVSVLLTMGTLGTTLATAVVAFFIIT